MIRKSIRASLVSWSVCLRIGEKVRGSGSGSRSRSGFILSIIKAGCTMVGWLVANNLFLE